MKKNKNKKAIKRVRKLHHPMEWTPHSIREVCSECRVPYPCKTITALNGE